jgi:maltose/moltooligosaccharide transporter
LERKLPDIGSVNARAIPEMVRISFWAGAFVFLSAVLVTVITTKEYPPSDQERERLKHTKAFDLAAILQSLMGMPRTMRQLAVLQFLTWLALFCMFLYFAVAVVHNVFGAQSTNEAAYTQGIIWAGYCSGVYNTVCFLVSPVLPGVAKRIGRRGTHSVCLLAGALGVLSIALIHNKWLLFLPMMGVGIAWASILSMAYSILSAAIPANKTGLYTGNFNFFIMIPEILSSVVFGWIMANVLNNDRMKDLVTEGICFTLAAVLMQRVKEAVVRDESLAPYRPRTRNPLEILVNGSLNRC